MNAKQKWLILLIVYLLFLAIGASAIVSVLGLLPNASPEFKQWSVVVLFADVAAAAIAVFKTQFNAKEARLFLNVTFDGVKTADIDLHECEFTVLDGDITVKKAGKASVVRGPGGWQIQFSWPAEASDTAHLTLIERSGRKWRVPSFSPTTIEQRAVPV